MAESAATAVRRRRVVGSGLFDRDTTVVAILFIVFALNFGAYRVFGDGAQYYSFVQRLFGDRPDASGYNFGVGLMNAPFYGVAKAVGAVVGHVARLERASITIASLSWALAAALISIRIVRALQLPAAAFCGGVALFGTPVWYYASFSPSYSHAADAATFALAAAGALGVWRSQALRWRVATGAALGLAIAVRPFNLGVAAGCVLALAVYRRFGDALIVSASAVCTTGVLLVLPLSLGLSLTNRVDGTSVSAGSVGLAPLSPLRMLFTPHRGLFIWTPVAFLAVIGLSFLLRRHRDRGYLVTLTAMGLGLLLMYVGLDWWDGGWSFSQRLLASPVALYAVGLGGLLAVTDRSRRYVVMAVALAATLWSVFLGMNHAFGASQPDGAFAVARKRSVDEFLHRMWSYSRVRHLVDRAKR
jgi:hypothetical protein